MQAKIWNDRYTTPHQIDKTGLLFDSKRNNSNAFSKCSIVDRKGSEVYFVSGARAHNGCFTIYLFVLRLVKNTQKETFYTQNTELYTHKQKKRMKSTICPSTKSMGWLDVKTPCASMYQSSYLWYIEPIRYNETRLMCLDLNTNLLYEGEPGMTHVEALAHERRKICFGYDKDKKYGVVSSCTSNETKMRQWKVFYDAPDYQYFSACKKEPYTIAMAKNHSIDLLDLNTGNIYKSEKRIKMGCDVNPFEDDNTNITSVHYCPQSDYRVGFATNNGLIGVLDARKRINECAILIDTNETIPNYALEFSGHTIVSCSSFGKIQTYDDRKYDQSLATFTPSNCSGYMRHSPKLIGCESNQLISVQGNRVYSFSNIDDPKLPHFYTQVYQQLSGCFILNEVTVITSGLN